MGFLVETVKIKEKPKGRSHKLWHWVHAQARKF
jgi:hypothetical protein